MYFLHVSHQRPFFKKYLKEFFETHGKMKKVDVNAEERVYNHQLKKSVSFNSITWFIRWDALTLYQNIKYPFNFIVVERVFSNKFEYKSLKFVIRFIDRISWLKIDCLSVWLAYRQKTTTENEI